MIEECYAHKLDYEAKQIKYSDKAFQTKPTSEEKEIKGFTKFYQNISDFLNLYILSGCFMLSDKKSFLSFGGIRLSIGIPHPDFLGEHIFPIVIFLGSLLNLETQSNYVFLMVANSIYSDSTFYSNFGKT